MTTGDRMFTVGAHVIADAQPAIIEQYHDAYPHQKWYWVRFVTPKVNAAFADIYPENATHGMFQEIELKAA